MPCSGNASHNLASRRTQGSANGSVRGRGVMGRHRNAKKGGRSPRGAGVGGSKALCQGTHLRPLVIYWASAAPAHARLPGANDQHYLSTQIPISVFFCWQRFRISIFDFVIAIKGHLTRKNVSIQYAVVAQIGQPERSRVFMLATEGWHIGTSGGGPISV